MKRDNPGDMTDRIFVQESVALGFDNLFLPGALFLFGLLGAMAILISEMGYKGKHCCSLKFFRVF